MGMHCSVEIQIEIQNIRQARCNVFSEGPLLERNVTKLGSSLKTLHLVLRILSVHQPFIFPFNIVFKGVKSFFHTI